MSQEWQSLLHCEIYCKQKHFDTFMITASEILKVILLHQTLTPGMDF